MPTSASAHGRRVALVTGRTDGICKAIAHVLAAAGIHLVIVGSNANNGAVAVRELRRACGHQPVEFLQADLSLMRDVDALAGEIGGVGRNCIISRHAPGEQLVHTARAAAIAASLSGLETPNTE